MKAMIGFRERAATDVARPLRRGERSRRGREIRSGIRRTARRSFDRSLLEHARDGFVRDVGRNREVPGTLLEIARDVRQAPVEIAAPIAAGTLVCGRGEKRMGESDVVSLQRNDVCLERWCQDRERVGFDDLADKRQRRLQSSSCDDECVPCSRGQRRYPLLDELLQRGRDRQRLSWNGCDLLSLQRACYLEREEDVSA
ncbi:MAG TPA: hypothetical protein VML35_02550 [Gaiellaceae bacterium]|nr:hypothetical protein [Gaiellaceae bacterium]